MGNSSEYKYGPVQDYSIKMSMNNDSDRGWTWCNNGQAPKAALSTGGKFQVASTITTRSSLIFYGNLYTNTTAYTKFQVARDDWGGSHALIFNGYKSGSNGGNLMDPNKIKYANSAGSFGGGAGMISFLGNGGRMDFLLSPSSTGKNNWISWGTPKMSILRNGNVGIGKKTPSAKLHVNGKIISEEIVVENVSGADFVFEDDYDLRSLEETEAFIKENKHLPEIPSAAAMAEDGLGLKKMNILLLQKIEEMTLHQIDLLKKIEALAEEVEALK